MDRRSRGCGCDVGGPSAAFGERRRAGAAEVQAGQQQPVRRLRESRVRHGPRRRERRGRRHHRQRLGRRRGARDRARARLSRTSASSTASRTSPRIRAESLACQAGRDRRQAGARARTRPASRASQRRAGLGPRAAGRLLREQRRQVHLDRGQRRRRHLHRRQRQHLQRPDADGRVVRRRRQPPGRRPAATTTPTPTSRRTTTSTTT